jgi:hypothetical protein
MAEPFLLPGQFFFPAIKKAGLPFELEGNPAILSLRPVAFRRRLAPGLALSVCLVNFVKKSLRDIN